MRKECSVVLPDLFMSARTSETQMTRLFVAGLQCGVRGFDTAREYRAEKAVGKALRRALDETGIKREEIFVQTRISNEEVISGKICDELLRSVENVGLGGYVDSFMFHWPTPDYYIDAWRKLVKIHENGNLTRSIGLCNVRKRHLEMMRKEGVVVMPQVIQVEVTPFWQIADLKTYCDGYGIKVQAFSPLCKMIEPIRTNPVLKGLAMKYDVSIPQVILRWNKQRGISPISMTAREDRVKTNFDIYSFALSDEDMDTIASLDCGWKYHLESATCVGF